jgi:ribosomal-protein-alanine N-acetyltransferase
MGTELDIPQIIDYYERNREHLAPGPQRPPDFRTAAYWRERLHQSAEAFEQDRALQLFLFHPPDEAAVGGTVALTEICRGALQACNLGYGLDAHLQGRGLMTEALGLVIAYAFGELHLHRLTAGYRPTNERSGRVLRRLGFDVYGYARDYLLLGGEWHDHVLVSLTNPRWREL